MNENNLERLDNSEPESVNSVESKADELSRLIADELAEYKTEEPVSDSDEPIEASPEAESEPEPEEASEESSESAEPEAVEEEPVEESVSVEDRLERFLSDESEVTETYSAPDDRADVIKLQNVSMTYDNITMALNDISLDIKEGEFVFIVGDNGAGKTTLTKLLICEERISSGRLFVNGFRLHKIRSWKIPKLRRTMGMVFQDFKLFDNMTVYENVAFAMRVVGAKPSLIRKRVPVFLEMVGMGHKTNSFPTELSGGERQRVAFARAIVNNPDIVIADEPTGNIDDKMTGGIMELLLKINKLGKTVIVITHDTQIVQSYNKRVVRLENGRVVSDRIGGDFQ